MEEDDAPASFGDGFGAADEEEEEEEDDASPSYPQNQLSQEIRDSQASQMSDAEIDDAFEVHGAPFTPRAYATT